MARLLAKLALLIIGIGSLIVGLLPQAALFLADAGDKLSAIALRLACR